MFKPNTTIPQNEKFKFFVHFFFFVSRWSLASVHAFLGPAFGRHYSCLCRLVHRTVCRLYSCSCDPLLRHLTFLCSYADQVLDQLILLMVGLKEHRSQLASQCSTNMVSVDDQNWHKPDQTGLTGAHKRSNRSVIFRIRQSADRSDRSTRNPSIFRNFVD